MRLPPRRTDTAVSFNETSKPTYALMVVLRHRQDQGYFPNQRFILAPNFDGTDIARPSRKRVQYDPRLPHVLCTAPALLRRQYWSDRTSGQFRDP
ncbi:hypothetical protein SPHINGOT1_380004 [Sphingomonas sp. T1]|nr:hypothetical protein SPHINGOT1_380004 [Sphingomonas sp. T1]